jgi:hypothetical protein
VLIDWFGGYRGQSHGVERRSAHPYLTLLFVYHRKEEEYGRTKHNQMKLGDRLSGSQNVRMKELYGQSPLLLFRG